MPTKCQNSNGAQVGWLDLTFTRSYICSKKLVSVSQALVECEFHKGKSWVCLSMMAAEEMSADCVGVHVTARQRA